MVFAKDFIVIIGSFYSQSYFEQSYALVENYNELSQKTGFQSVPIAALCLYNIQRENLVLKNSLCTLAHKHTLCSKIKHHLIVRDVDYTDISLGA